MDFDFNSPVSFSPDADSVEVGQSCW